MKEIPTSLSLLDQDSGQTERCKLGQLVQQDALR